MKKISFILLIVFALPTLWCHGQNKANTWNHLDSLVTYRHFATARTMAEEALRKAQVKGDGKECLLATFYLTAIDYAYEKHATDSAIVRYSALTHSLQGADRAVAYAFLFQTYGQVYSQNYYRIERNKPSDDPKLPYRSWHRQRIEDTLMTYVDSIVAYADLLRETSPDGYRRMFRRDSLTPPPIDNSLLGMLVQALVSGNGRNNDFRQKVVRRVAGLYADGSADMTLWFDLHRSAFLLSDSLYLASLDSLDALYSSKNLSPDMRALLCYKRASALSILDRKVAAEQLCFETERRYPGTYGARCCRQLRKYICQPEYSIRFSQTESSRSSRLAVIKARNTSLLHMRLVRQDSLSSHCHNWPEDTLRRIGAVAEWDQPLPDSGDHLKHHYLVSLPAVAQGDYYLVAYTDSSLCYVRFQSADGLFITYGLSAAAGKKTLLWPSSGYLVDRITGQPLAGKKVTLHGEGDITGRDRTRHCRTDKKGYFHFPVSSWQYRFIQYKELTANVDGYEFNYDDQSYLWDGVHSTSRDYNQTTHQLEVVMTDRPIYRLGDTVQFLCVAYDRSEHGSRWEPRIRPAKNLKLKAFFFNSSSVQEDSLFLTTDRQGRCWGRFVVPADGRNGSYTLRVCSDDGKYYEYEYIDVEAYKPPHFTVTLSTAEEGVDTVAVRRMGQPVTLYGMAASYSGAPMTGAQVRWEVSRERLRDPLQWQTLADEYPYHDSLTVNDDGTFQFTFTPTPDEKDTNRYTTYIFTAYARVIDADGELQESRLSLRVSGADGYCLLSSLTHATQSIKQSSTQALKQSGNQAILTYCYNNFDHQPLKGMVHVTVQQLRQPDTLRFLEPQLMAEYRDARWVGSEADFRRQFPHLAFTPEEADPHRWPVVETRLDTLTSERSIALDDLPSGMYRLLFEMPDGMRHDTVVNYVAPGGRVTGTDLVWMRTTPPNTYDWFPIACSVGDTLRIEMGSPFGNQPLYYRVTNAAEIISQGMLVLDSSKTTLLSIPITKDMSQERCVVSLAAVRDGRDFQRTLRLVVLHPELQCKIETETFRDRLQPGEREQWRLRIMDADSAGIEANLCMTMYDKSLEQYRRLRFGLNPWIDRGGYRFDYRFDYPRTNIIISETRFGHFQPATIPFNVYTVGYQPQLGYTLWSLDDWHKQIAMRYGAGTLKGTITDAKTGEELPFVNVVLKYNGKQFNGASTDFDGYYSFQLLPSGNYELEISYVGYNRVIYKVNVRNIGATICDIQLTPSAVSLDEIVIMDDKAPVMEIGAPEHGARMSSEDIQRMPGNSVEDVVAVVGGMGYSDGGVSDMVTLQGSVRKRTGVNVPKDAIAEIAPAFDFDGTNQFSILNSQFSIRKNLSTLAFFEPALRSGKDGSVTVSFTMPDALTQWSVKAFAWTDDYALGGLERVVQTQKELMVQPQLPRFLRQGDTIELRAKVSNLTESTLTAKVCFEIEGKRVADTTVTLEPRTGAPASCRFVVDNNCQSTAEYKIYASSGSHTDGERGSLPVLSDKERVTTSRLLYIAGSPDGSEVSRTYTLPARRAGDSLDIVFTARPMDYAFEALPHFKRHRMPGNIYMVNSVFVDHVASLNPSATEKERTKAASRIKSQLHDLLQAQQRDGGWSWMPGGREASLYTTEAVLQRLATCPSLADDSYYRRDYIKAIDYLDRQLLEQYKRDTVSQFSIFNSQFSILYTRSLWLGLKPLDKCDSLTRQAYSYYLQRARRHTMEPDLTLRSQGQLALTLLHMGDTAEAVRMATIIRESAHVADSLGMYWNDLRVEDAALMVDVMADVMHDWEAVSRIQQWILSYRQGTTWRTDMATAQAVAALLRTPEGLAAPDTSRTATYAIKQSDNQAITIELRSTSPFPAWGAVFYSHDTPLDSIRTEGTGITLRRTLSTVATDGSLTLLKPGQKLQVGERVRVHIDIYCERDLDRMVLRDQRAAGFEPVSTASGWCWNDGLRYYVDIRDEAADCYIDRLNEGHYYVEYDLWVRHAGAFATGICTLQSVYAPEFRCHTESQQVRSRFSGQ